jgi:DNA-binding IclR family transcriptional regulator
MFGMPIARTLQVAQRTCVLGELASGPATAAELATKLGLREQGTSLVLDVLCASGIVDFASDGHYSLTSRAAKWLRPREGADVAAAARAGATAGRAGGVGVRRGVE